MQNISVLGYFNLLVSVDFAYLIAHFHFFAFRFIFQSSDAHLNVVLIKIIIE